MEDIQPPQGEQSEEHDSRYIFFKDKMFKLVVNLGDGLCLFHSVSSFLRDLVQQETSSIPNIWVQFLSLNDSNRFRDSQAAWYLTRFLCTLSEADFDVLITYYRFNDDENTKQLPVEYSSIFENLRDNVLVNTEQDLKENIFKWVNCLIFEMINTTNTMDGSWPGDIHALVLSKVLKIRIVIVSNDCSGFKENWFDTDQAFFISKFHNFQTPCQVQHPKVKKHATCIEYIQNILPTHVNGKMP